MTMSEERTSTVGTLPAPVSPNEEAPEPRVTPPPIRLHRRARTLGKSSYALLAATIFCAGAVVGGYLKKAPATTATARTGATASSTVTTARTGSSSATTTGVASTAAGAAGSFPGGGPGGGTSGTVNSVKDGALVITTADGRTVTVTLGANATVTVRGTLADLHAGDAIVVQGTTAADGTITASRITPATGTSATGGATTTTATTTRS